MATENRATTNDTVTIATRWLARVLGRKVATLAIRGCTLNWRSGADVGSLPVGQIDDIRVSSGLLWVTVVVMRSGDRADIRLVGFHPKNANRFVAGVNLLKVHGDIAEVLAGFDQPEGIDQYLTKPAHTRWRKHFASLVEQVRPLLMAEPAAGVDIRQGERFVDLWDRGEDARIERNEAWVERQAAKHAKLFSSGLGYPLNEEQIAAVLHDEHRSLIVAGAGTGKTSTITGKAAWILAQGLAQPGEVLMLAFNRDAAREMEGRIEQLAQVVPFVSTFHALGNAIIARARRGKPNLSPLAEDELALQKFIRGLIDQGLADTTLSTRVIIFLVYFRYPEPTPVPVEGSHESHRWAAGHDLRSLTGVRMKSVQETIIGDWLSLHGISWEYEREYEVRTITAEHRQYRPDFFLPVRGVYIEHWACDRLGRLPDSWDAKVQKRYKDKMAWARSIHKLKGTKLVETFSRPNGQLSLVDDLEQALRKNGVVRRELNQEDRTKLFAGASEVIASVTRLVQSFLSLYRENNAGIDRLWARIAETKDSRAMAFVDMFEWILECYEKHLASNGEVDFSDMIRDSAAALREERDVLAVKYLLVDEFQDISAGRADLIRAILEMNPNCRLCAVGDDWQSIYRFAGSDIDLMVQFKDHFGFTRRVDLRRTHRFGSKLLEASSRFIQANPQQLRKDLISGRVDDSPALEIIGSETGEFSIGDASSGTDRASSVSDVMLTDAGWAGASRVADSVRRGDGQVLDPEQQVEEAYRRIALHAGGPADVLVLGRYGFQKRAAREGLASQYGLKARFSTVHRAKGTEADYVVVLDVNAGRYGFPSEMTDDPLLALVLAGGMPFRNAEERRLFYVAMTRARKKAYLLTDEHRRSAFIDELESNDFKGLVVGSAGAARILNCPVCLGGQLQRRAGPAGEFYGCANYPYCRGKAAVCPHCESRGFHRKDAQFACLFCGGTARACPQCGEGYVREVPAGISQRTGRQYGEFLGCSRYQAAAQFGCSYAVKVGYSGYSGRTHRKRRR